MTQGVGYTAGVAESVAIDDRVESKVSRSGTPANGPGSGNAGGSVSSAIRWIRSFWSAINKINGFLERHPEIRDWIVEQIQRAPESVCTLATGQPRTWHGREFSGWARTARFASVKKGRRAGMVRGPVAANAIMRCTDLPLKSRVEAGGSD